MRTQRMQFLTETANQLGCRYVALAHSVDDNVETVLHHLMRGTGPAGLAGMGSPRALDEDLVLVRPLLGLGRDLIRAALQDLGQPWREDASNQDLRYRRNWIRRELIPLIQSQYPDATEAIGRAIESQRQWRQVIDQDARQWTDSVHVRANHLSVPRDHRHVTAIVIAGLQQLWVVQGWPRGGMSREHWMRLAATIAGDQLERYTLPGDIDVDATGPSVEVRAHS